MMNAPSSTILHHHERPGLRLPGWLMLVVVLVFLGFAIFFVVCGLFGPSSLLAYAFLPAGGSLLIAILVASGLFVLVPNEAAVLTFFGQYKGTVRQGGLHWTSPFNSRTKISLRIQNQETGQLKVNDRRGNPIEIAAVVVWRIEDTAQALFDVQNYRQYLTIQSESAIRHLAASYSYDEDEETGLSLRAGGNVVLESLRQELGERLARAGVAVEEARLTHLSYAPEIAQVMLRRQQAEAVISARQKIVQGAVGMVEMALTQLAEKRLIELDDERKAAMVGNLLVVLCGEAEVTPVINTSSRRSSDANRAT